MPFEFLAQVGQPDWALRFCAARRCVWRKDPGAAIRPALPAIRIPHSGSPSEVAET